MGRTSACFALALASWIGAQFFQTSPGLMAPVTVVIPCYQCAPTIGRAVASVKRQTVPVQEIILVDDGSQDGTGAALRELAAVFDGGPVKLLRLPENRGPGSARNAGWNAARGEYVAFLDADDAWHPRKIELQYGWMKSHPDAVLSGHAYAVASSFPLAEQRALGEATVVTPTMLLISNRFHTPCAMLRRSIAQRFAEGKRYGEDYLLWLQIVLAGGPAYRFEAPLATLFKPAYGASGLSARLWKMQAGEMDALARLRRDSLLGWSAYAAAAVWSCLKFTRRLVATALPLR